MRVARAPGLLLAIALPLLACKHAASRTSGPNCGFGTDDWCKAVGSDPCNAHTNQHECKADPKCEALPYRGESAVACRTDSRCFATNCPAIGCITRCGELSESTCDREEICLWKGQGGACTPGEHRCRWDGTRCVRAEACASGVPAPAPSR